MVDECFQEFEARMHAVGRQFPGLPRQEVMLVRLAHMVYKRLDEVISRHLAPHELSSSQWLALILIYSSAEGAILPSEISHIADSSRTNVTRLVDELVAKGWVSRTHSQEDRRKITLALTNAGASLVERVLPVLWEAYRKLWAPFSAEEMAEMERLQRKLLQSLTDC